MTIVYIISFLLIAFGIVRILGLTPESIGTDVSSILDRKKSLRDNAMRARGKKRTNKLVLWLDKIRRALSDTGKEKSFGVACAVALLLMILGCVGAIVIGNPFLAPVLAIALAMIPFLYLLRTVEQYEEQVKLELETGLSAITSSYEPQKRGGGEHRQPQTARQGTVSELSCGNLGYQSRCQSGNLPPAGTGKGLCVGGMVRYHDLVSGR